VGDHGTILCGFNGGNPRLISGQRKADAALPAAKRSRSGGGANIREWIDACKGAKTKPGANFEFSGVVTEALQLGNISRLTSRRSRESARTT